MQKQPFSSLIATFLLTFLATHPALAQDDAPTTSEVPPANTAANTVQLAQATTTIRALNLTLYLPEGSVAETISYGSESTTAVAFPDDVGLLTIKGQKTTNPDLTTKIVADSIIARLTVDQYNRTIGQLLSRTQIRIKFWTGERFYIRQRDPKGGPDLILGYTIFQNKPRSFIVFELRTDIETRQHAQLLYETTIGTLDLGNPGLENARRSAAIKSTLAFMDSLSIKDYQSVLTGKNTDHWHRLYTPAASGDEMDATEHGYRRIRSWAGFKGEISKKDRSKWTHDDRTPGYIFQLDAMALEKDLRIDTRAIFFVSDAQDDESWTIRMSLIQKETEFNEETKINSSITGARHGTSMTIYLEQNNQPPAATRPLIEGEGYISQVQAYLHTALLAAKRQQGEYASYAYNSSANAITLRWDTVEQPEETPGLWRITTKTSDTAPAAVTFYNENNTFLRVRLANGRIWEPIELDRLVKLWKKKGLPLE